MSRLLEAALTLSPGPSTWPKAAHEDQPGDPSLPWPGPSVFKEISHTEWKE